jgi:hypothetical protein
MDRVQFLAMLVQLSFDTDQLLLTHGDDAGVLGDGPARFSATLGHFLDGYMLARQELVESEDELNFLLAIGKTGGGNCSD